MKNSRGVTLISLMLTVMIILILTGAMIFNTKNQLQMKKVQSLSVDIENLNSKVDEYYLKYGELPILCNYTNKTDFNTYINSKAQNHNSELNSPPNVNDGNDYVVIDLERLSGLTLNYGYEEQYKELKISKDITADSDIEDEIYVINTVTHQIYFPHGIFAEGMMYYTF